jgi:hypothetical protein
VATKIAEILDDWMLIYRILPFMGSKKEFEEKKYLHQLLF